MKKLFFALLVTVMSLTILAGFNTKTASAASADGYVWWDEWEAAGKKVMYSRETRSYYDTSVYKYSGYDVVFGDYVLPVVKQQLVKRSSLAQDLNVIPYDSISALYINDTANPWVVTFKSTTQFFAINVDANGKVTSIDNGSVAFNFEGAETGKYYDVWWNNETGEMEYRDGALQKHKPQVDVQLTYGDLGTTYPWLTKETVDGNKVEGLTFADTDVLYKDTDGKYTNDAGTSNTPVMNEQKGVIIPSGGFTIFINYWDNSYLAPNHRDKYLPNLWKLVNGQDNVASIVLQDRFFKPEILGTKTGEFELLVNGTFDPFAGVIAQNVKKEALPLISTITKLNPVTDQFDIPVVQKTKDGLFTYNELTQLYDLPATDFAMDYSKIGTRYQVEHKSTDATLNLTSVKTYEIEVIESYTPIITGPTEKLVNMGQKVNLLDGMVADDGYGLDISKDIKVFAGSLDVNNPKPGTYEVLYLVTNSHRVTSTRTAKVTVLDTEKPVASGPTERVVITKGTPFDLTSVVTGTDNYSKSIKVAVTKDNWFDVNRVGVYTIELQVSDESGNKTKVTYEIEVSETYKDELTRISDLEAELAALTEELATTNDNLDSAKEELNAKIANATKAINDLKAELNASLDAKDAELKSKIAALEAKLTDVQGTSDEKDQQAMIFTIIVAVLSVAGLGVSLKAFKK